jgi:hypothetical protein
LFTGGTPLVTWSPIIRFSQKLGIAKRGEHEEHIRVGIGESKGGLFVWFRPYEAKVRLQLLLFAKCLSPR